MPPFDKITLHRDTAMELRRQLQEARVDHAAFEQRLSPCELSQCRATCCHDGVCLSPEEMAALQALLTRHEAQFHAYGLALSAATAFEERPHGGGWKTATRAASPAELAADFPAHFPRTRCVFLDNEHRCAWQRLAVDEGQPSWFFKPITCWMHPVSLQSGTHADPRPTLTLHVAAHDPQRTEKYPGFASCTQCGRADAAGNPAVAVLHAELQQLAAIADRDFVAELNGPPVSSPCSSPSPCHRDA